MLSKKIIALVLASALSLTAGAWFFNLNNYDSTEVATASEAQAIIYGTPNCLYCKKARKLLSEQGVAFFEYNINEDEKALQRFNELGGRGTPVVVVNDSVLLGYNEEKLLAAIN